MLSLKIGRINKQKIIIQRKERKKWSKKCFHNHQKNNYHAQKKKRLEIVHNNLQIGSLKNNYNLEDSKELINQYI